MAVLLDLVQIAAAHRRRVGPDRTVVTGGSRVLRTEYLSEVPNTVAGIDESLDERVVGSRERGVTDEDFRGLPTT